MELARLGVDEVGGERARVAAEERVRERAVAPEEAAEVEADEELRARVEQPPAQVGDAAASEERPERERVVEVARDQDRVEVAAAIGDDADRLHHRHLVGRERAQQPVLALRQLDRQLLERVQLRPEPRLRTRRSARRGGGFRARPRRAARASTPRAARPRAGRGSPGARCARSAEAGRASQPPWSSWSRVRNIACDQRSGEGGGPHFGDPGLELVGVEQVILRLLRQVALRCRVRSDPLEPSRRRWSGSASPSIAVSSSHSPPP